MPLLLFLFNFFTFYTKHFFRFIIDFDKWAHKNNKTASSSLHFSLVRLLGTRKLKVTRQFLWSVFAPVQLICYNLQLIRGEVGASSHTVTDKVTFTRLISRGRVRFRLRNRLYYRIVRNSLRTIISIIEKGANSAESERILLESTK